MQEHDSPILAEADEQIAETATPTLEVLGGTPLLTWQASEYIHHQKKAGWYVILFVVAAAMVALGVVTHQWSSIAVLAAGIIAILMYANKAPRTLNYSLSEDGLTIDAKFHPFNHFRSFSVVTDVAWHTIDLDPVQRFMPRLTILFDDEDLPSIVDALSKELPRFDRPPDTIERLTRYLKF